MNDIEFGLISRILVGEESVDTEKIGDILFKIWYELFDIENDEWYVEKE